MYRINKMPHQISSQLIKSLERVETATVGHYLYDAFVDRHITARLPRTRIAGTAVTLRIPHADSTLLHYLTKLVRPGDVVVIDRCGDDTYACWGGGISNAMKLAGVAAGIIDGPATDLSEIERLQMPVWSRGLSPRTTRLLNQFGEINVPVTIGGKAIHPGDAILADECGVLVLPPEQVEAVVTKALDAQDWEVGMVERMSKGEWLPDITGATELVEAKLR